MVCLPEFKAGRAEVCRIEKVNDQGAGTISYVRLPDGYLIDCGYGGGSEERAKAIAGCINALMKWEGAWPPCGDPISTIERNAISAEEWRPANAPAPEGR